MEETKYRYNDISERYRKMNRLNLIAIGFLSAVILAYMWLKLLNGHIQTITVFSNTFLIIVFLALNAVLYLRDRATTRLKVAATVEMALEYLLLGAQTDASFIHYILIGILILQIPYYDLKGIKYTGIITGVSYILVLVIQAVKGITGNDVEAICIVLCVLALILTSTNVGKIAILFNDDAFGAIDEEHQKQQAIMDGIISTSQTIQVESEKSGELIEKLVSATQSVTESMQEITDSSNTTAQSIEEQNNMTNSIQDAIEVTGQSSRQMVQIATNSNESIQQNIQVMEDLKEQSTQITETNNEVTQAMTKLQNKTKEVEEIAGMILNISNQTNLLALNASIESARAGEAGKGFAVVAEQIRQLAEQTRNSTEEITAIVNELNENANEVVQSVQVSVEATQSQNEKIMAASEAFEQLGKNIGELVNHIEEVNTQVDGLAGSNNKIVENISQLSAATEEVTASAEQVHGMSEQNLDHAEAVKASVDRIRSTADDMKKYI